MRGKVIVVLVFLFVLMGANRLPGERVGTLPEVLKPSNIDVSGNRLFVMDTDQIRIYSIPDTKLLKTFGKQGEGPGEYKITIFIPLRIKALEDSLLLEAGDKIIFYSLDGVYKSEKKKDFFLNSVTPVNGKFLARRIVQPQSGTVSTSMIGIYDRDLKLVKEIYRQKFIQQGQGPGTRLDMGQDFLIFRVYDNKIFVEQSPEGFIIGVYDLNGEKLYDIKKSVEKVKITSDRKHQIMEDFKSDPHIVRQMKQQGIDWKTIQQILTFDFPEYFPPIRNMEVGHDRIYVQTYYREGDRDEFLILDLKGKQLKRTMIREFQRQHMMSTVLGIRLSTMVDGKIYYVKENEDEEWELHRVTIQ